MSNTAGVLKKTGPVYRSRASGITHVFSSSFLFVFVLFHVPNLAGYVHLLLLFRFSNIQEHYIREHTRLIYDPKEKAAEENIHGRVLLLHFEKAFYIVELSYLFSIIDVMAFPDTMNDNACLRSVLHMICRSNLLSIY
jgi:hypothetical protein